MAIISLSKAQLKSGSNPSSPILAGEALTEGELVYKDQNDSGKLKKAVNSSSTAAAVAGICVTDADSGNNCLIAENGATIITSGLTQGSAYYLSSTAGDIELESDMLSGDYVTQIGVAVSATELKLAINATGVTK